MHPPLLAGALIVLGLIALAGPPPLRAQTATIASADQFDVSGAWFDPATAGQGLLIEVIDSASRGGGNGPYFFGSWFTYSSTAGGVSEQAWYMLEGTAPVGAKRFDLSLGRTTPARFNSGTATQRRVGSATIEFTSCTRATLSWRFDAAEGGRSGTMALQRLLADGSCDAGARVANAAPSFTSTGGWYEPRTAGQGLFLEVNPRNDLLFGAWYTYAPSGNADHRWFTLQKSGANALARDVRDVPILETTGGRIGVGGGTTIRQVGTADVRFDSCTSGSMTYRFTAGELSGQTGSIPLSRVANVPVECIDAATPLTRTPTPAQASRFLNQAGFGGRRTDIDALTRSTLPAWLDTQFNAPRASYYDQVTGIANRFYGGGINQGPLANVEAIMLQAAYGPDPLRQKTAWALSQIFVIGAGNPAVDSSNGRYFLDILNRNAFGNFRQLLEDVTLSQSMGLYLSHIGNEKEDPTTGRLPDENYAREIMQLFTIGLWELNPDGTRKIGPNGQPIPTYGQDDIRGLAKVFTGFTLRRCLTDSNPWICMHGSRLNWWQEGTIVPFERFHSTSEKRFLGRTLPGGRTANQDLKDALDHLFAHPNVGPFVGRQLIQRFVTSNPSPAYVRRVAAAFDNNGQGVRGDMTAVVRAVLLDPEARDDRMAGRAEAGKLREPMARWWQYLRTTGRAGNEGRAYYDWTRMIPAFGQWPLNSPSVFNFYRPDYSPPGPLRRAGLVAPEFQITHEFTAAATHNEFTLWTTWDNKGLYGEHFDDFGALLPLARNSESLVDELDLLFTYRTLSPASRKAIIDAVNAVPPWEGDVAKLKLALRLVLVSPDYAILK
jgi:uncharacterized protein (DUF1800 family)